MTSVDSKYLREIRYEDAESLLKTINYGRELYSSWSREFIFRGHYSDAFLSLQRREMEHGGGKRDYEEDCVLLASKLKIAQILGEYHLLQSYYDLCDSNHLKVPECARLVGMIYIIAA